MGQNGPFNEYQNTTSYDGLYREPTNKPAVTSLLITSGTNNPGPWREIYVVSASYFAALSGSLGGAVNTTLWPAGTKLQGVFTECRLSSGVVVASREKTL